MGDKPSKDSKNETPSNRKESLMPDNVNKTDLEQLCKITNLQQTEVTLMFKAFKSQNPSKNYIFISIFENKL